MTAEPLLRRGLYWQLAHDGCLRERCF